MAGAFQCADENRPITVVNTFPFQEHRSKQSPRTIFLQSSGRGSSIIPWPKYNPERERRCVIASHRKPASKSRAPLAPLVANSPSFETVERSERWVSNAHGHEAVSHLLPPDSTHTKKRRNRLALFLSARERETLFGEIGWSISLRKLTLPKKSKVMAHRMLNNVSKGRSL